MANVKTGKWLPKETAKLQNIPKDSKLNSVLTKIALKLNRPYNLVYQKWYSIWKKEQKNPKISTKNIPAMELKVDMEYEGKNTDIDPMEKLALEKGLEKTVPSLLPGRGAVLVPKRYERVARAWLDKNHPAHIYKFHVITGNNKEKRLMRKV
jgi:hypothetical protein